MVSFPASRAHRGGVLLLGSLVIGLVVGWIAQMLLGTGTRPHRSAVRQPAALLACLAFVLVAGGCGDDDSDDSGSGSDSGDGAAAVCDELDALEEDVAALGDVNVVEKGTSALEEPLDTIRDDLEALSDDAGDELRPEVDALRTTVSDLETAIADVDEVGASGVATAVGDVVDALGDVGTEISETDCPD